MSKSATEIARKIQKKVECGEWTLDGVESAVLLIRMRDQVREAGVSSEPTGEDLPCQKKEPHEPHLWGHLARFNCWGLYPYPEDDRTKDRVKVEEPEADADELLVSEVVEELVDRVFGRVEEALGRFFDKR